MPQPQAQPVDSSTQAIDDIAPIDPDLARRLLATASITISSWRWKLRDAGYPFREPPGIDKLIQEIDLALFPPTERARNYKLTRPRAPDPTPEQLERARTLLGIVR